MNTPGLRGANQYQNFLSDLQGPANGNNEHNGIGMPYYRSVIKPEYLPYYRPPYQPRVKTEKSFEETQRLISEKYFAYFEEKDPKKRARLLKDYSRARMLANRELSVRREDPAHILDPSTRLESEPRSSMFGRTPAGRPQRRLLGRTHLPCPGCVPVVSTPHAEADLDCCLHHPPCRSTRRLGPGRVALRPTY